VHITFILFLFGNRVCDAHHIKRKSLPVVIINLCFKGEPLTGDEYVCFCFFFNMKIAFKAMDWMSQLVRKTQKHSFLNTENAQPSSMGIKVP
jgi:hypothetical protein